MRFFGIFSCTFLPSHTNEKGFRFQIFGTVDKILKTIKTSQQINFNNKTKQEKEQSWEVTAGDNIYPTTPLIVSKRS